MRYAAYGSNLHPRRLSDRISSAKLIGTGYLPNRSLRFHKRSLDESGKCNIISEGRGVHVGVFELSSADKAILDKIEGLGSGYVGTSLQVPEIGLCESYVAEYSYTDDSLIPYDWYKELVLLGARFHKFPDSYIEEIDAVATRRDPDQYRSSKWWSTVESIKADA